MQQLVPALLAAMLILAPLSARAADLVVWWSEGYTNQEDEAVREVIAAFEEKTGKQVELVLHPEPELPDTVVAAVEAGKPPDFVFSVIGIQDDVQWAYDGRLVDLTDAVGYFADQFDPYALDLVTLLDGTTGRRGLYLLPVGFATHHVHAWKSLLEQAGFTLADIPKGWHAFWSFWCDQVQPAVRQALGRDDVWGVGVSMWADSPDTENGLWQFVYASDADYVTRDGRLVVDDPEVRRRLIQAIDGYTAIYRKGCTPPDSITWAAGDNNEQFLAQNIVMTLNVTLSIPNMLKATRPDDYYENAVTIDWPDGVYGQPLAIETSINCAMFSRTGATSTQPRNSYASWSARAGSPTISTSRATACCRRCRSCFRRHSGWTRATRTGCAPPCSSRPRSLLLLRSLRTRLGALRGIFRLAESTCSASPPRASAPSRRSTRRSRASSRF